MHRCAKQFKLLLTITVMLIAMAAMTATAYAGGDVDLGNIIKGANKDGTFYSGDRAYVKMADLDAAYGGSGSFSTLYAQGKVECYFYADDTQLFAFYDKSNEEFYYNVHPNCYGKDLCFYTHSVNSEDSHYNNNSNDVHVSTAISFTISKDGLVSVRCDTDGARTFKNVKVRGAVSVIPKSQIGAKNFSFTFSVTDTKNYSVGRHSLTGYMDDGSECAPLNKIPVSIYTAPSLAANMFETEKGHFVITPGSFNTYECGDLYIDYKQGKSGTWSTQWGPLSPNSPGKIAKLKPGSTYYVRAYYVKQVSGEYFIGPVSGEVGIKTGPKAKPAVKSVKISKAKVKKVKVKGKYYWDNGQLKYLKGFTTYETTYKVTIKFKKKPGVAGIEVYAGGVTLPTFIKGNKKTYTAKFTVGGKAKGKKTSFKIRTKGNKTYGAWSPFVTKKKVKIK